MKDKIDKTNNLSKAELEAIFAPRHRLLTILASLRRGEKLSPTDRVYYNRLLPGLGSDERKKRLARLEERWTTKKINTDKAMVVDFLSPDNGKFFANHEKKDAMLDLSFLNFKDHKIIFEQSVNVHLPISFLHSEFGEVYFQWARFQKKVNFRAAVFHKKVKFIDSTFDNIANFEFTIFHKKSEFSGIAFYDRAAFNFAIFENYVSFKGSSFRALLIDEAHFSILPNFRYTLFEKRVRFHSVYIPGPRESIAHDDSKEKLANLSLADRWRRNKSYEDKYRTLKEMAMSTNDHLHEQEFHGYELESKWLFKEFSGRWCLWVGIPWLIIFFTMVDRNFWPMIVMPLLFSSLSYLPLFIMIENMVRRKSASPHNRASAHFRGLEKLSYDFYNIAYLYLLRIYWLVSYYGQSLARPFVGFALLPFVFVFSYWRVERDISFSTAIHFSTLNMVPGNSLFRFNHLEYLKEKIFGASDVSLENFQSLVVTYSKEITLAHDSLIHLQEGLSLFFLFLIGLAIRNKFRIT